MLADTDFTRKSGEHGTSMFSYPGRRTTYYYECFFAKPPPSVQSRVFETIDKHAEEEQRAALEEEARYENNGGYLKRQARERPQAQVKREIEQAFSGGHGESRSLFEERNEEAMLQSFFTSNNGARSSFMALPRDKALNSMVSFDVL